jgi:hypothetical protein
MSISIDDVREFARFAEGVLENTGADSLVDLARQWETAGRETKPLSASRPEDAAADAKALEMLAAAFPEVDDPRQLEAALSRRGGVTTAQLIKNAVQAAEKASRQ